jgi:hypothetical protein
MRDPREYKQWFPPAVGFGDFNEPRYVDASARLNLLRSEFKLLALTVDSDDSNEDVYGRGFARSRLWHDYAGRGSGVCLVLRKDDAVRTITEQLESLGRAAYGAVRYENKRISQEITLGFEELAGDLDAIADRIAESYLEPLFLTKNTEWESEREYRFVVRSRSEYEFVDIAACLHAVCRGPGSFRRAEQALGHFARELGIALGYVEWNSNRPILIGRRIG